LAILLSEQCDRAHFLGKVLSGLNYRYGDVVEDDLVDELLDFGQFSFADGGEMGEVEPQPVRADKRPGLVYMPADDLFEGSVEKVGGSVVAGRVPVPRHFHDHLDGVAGLEGALFDVADMIYGAIGQFLGVLTCILPSGPAMTPASPTWPPLSA
jgi:hypothetical protein